MNIAQAKLQVKNAVRAYLAKDERGEYVIPVENQRPVLLMGAPGIGKTAIMSQVAHELGCGLVSYSMTHHTRQSALGLPYIAEENFGGEECRVSKYTMSEIIAAVHESIEQTGISEGILFLDEINCVSETLAPAMLQFLQFKTFGTHRVPQGWVIVTAGNPPEYNGSVREFDIVTLDRLKRVDIEPDYEAWKAFALDSGVHPAVTTYLELKKSNFYKVETTVEGKSFVTARGWVDLSMMLQLYERQGIEVDVDLVSQYLQDAEIARDFANYYQIFDKYRADYQVADILAGEIPEGIVARAAAAPFDEKLSLVGLITDACMEQLGACAAEEALISSLLADLRVLKETPADAERMIGKFVSARRQRLEKEARSATLTRADRYRLEDEIAFYEEFGAEGYEGLKDAFQQRLAAFKARVAETKASLESAFEFFEQAFVEGSEILIFVTELTASETAAAFIGRYGCEKYFQHNKELLFYERQKEIIAQLTDFSL